MKFKNKKLNIFAKIKNYVWGSFWIVFSLIIAVSIFSYNKNDISFNSVSTIEKTSNFLGRFGANVADVFLQLFGFATILFVFIFFILGIKIILNKTIYI